MSDCASIDPLITPYIDDAIGAAERRLVDEHVRACPPCHSRVAAERAVYELMCTKRAELSGVTASPQLHDRCAALRRIASSAPGNTASTGAWRGRLVPFALAAGVFVAVGTASMYMMTERSSKLLAAELTADHVKCFGMQSMLPVTGDSAEADRKMTSTFGWHLPLPEQVAEAGMELLGARVCLYGRGLAAHLMYSHNGKPVSVFMIPEMSRAKSVVDVMGHEAAIWSRDGRTFVLVAREPEADVSQMTAVIQAVLH